MKYTKLLVAVLSLAMFFACNNSSNETKKAEESLELITKLLNENNLTEAKTAVDSFHVQYPKLVKLRKEAVALNDSIILRESRLTVRRCNSAIPKLVDELKKVEANFSYQKNEKYDDFGRFVHATQTNERNNEKNYLKCELDENNDVYLTSYYCGQKMNHTQISVEANGQTIKTNKGTFYSFNENGKTYEQLTFKNEADSTIIEFIANHKNVAIKVTLYGNTQYSYNLPAQTKQAISETYRFIELKKSIKQTENELRIAQQRIGKITLLYN
jgi:hypothetical protein